MVRVAAGHLIHLPSRPLIGSFYVQGRLLLLEAHVACLRVATPVDQLPRIDAQIAARAPPHVPPAAAPAGGEELDLFMVSCYHHQASSPHAHAAYGRPAPAGPGCPVRALCYV